MGTIEILTVEELLRATETTITLPGLSEALGRPVAIRCRKISSAEYSSFFPDPPDEAKDWPSDPGAWAECERAWLKTLSPAELAARAEAVREVALKTIAAAAIEPRLTLEEARRFGNDVQILVVEILKFSGLLKPVREPAGKPPAEPAPDPAPPADAA